VTDRQACDCVWSVRRVYVHGVLSLTEFMSTPRVKERECW